MGTATDTCMVCGATFAIVAVMKHAQWHRVNIEDIWREAQR